jgi:hypothetical protein
VNHPTPVWLHTPPVSDKSSHKINDGSWIVIFASRANQPARGDAHTLTINRVSVIGFLSLSLYNNRLINEFSSLVNKRKTCFTSVMRGFTQSAGKTARHKMLLAFMLPEAATRIKLCSLFAPQRGMEASTP